MGLLDNLFGGNKKTENYAEAGKGAGTSAKGSAGMNSSADADMLHREIHFQFGTKHPVPFQDAGTGLMVNVLARGSASVKVEDFAAYKNVDEVSEKGRAMVSELLEQFLRNQSGSMEVKMLLPNKMEIERKFKEALEEPLRQCGLKPVMVSIVGMNVDEAAPAMAGASAPQPQAAGQPQGTPQPEAAEQPQGTPQPEAAEQPQGMPQPEAAGYRPKFCPNCGSPTGESGKFCRNCGTNLG